MEHPRPAAFTSWGPAIWLSLAVSLVLVVAPGAWDGVFAGPPLSWPACLLILGLAAAFIWMSLFRPAGQPSRRTAAAMIALVAAKLALGAIDAPYGWTGTYTVPDDISPRVAPFFARFSARTFRIDRRIDFNGPTFALHALNDLQRYGRTHFTAPRIEALPLTAVWSTWIDAAAPQELALDVAGSAPIEIRIDSQAVDAAEGSARTARTMVAPGRHHVEVTYRKPPATPASIAVDVTLGGVPAPLQAFSDRRPAGRWAAPASDACVLIGLALLLHQLWRAFGSAGPLRPRRPAAAAGAIAVWATCAAVLVWAALVAQTAHGVFSELGVGDDWLAYEALARNVMEEGLLMPNGKPLGQGEPYFFYPVYSYALAGVHWLLGEDYSAVMIFNGICASLVPLLLWIIGWYRLPMIGLLPGLLALLAVLINSSTYWRHALTDNLFIPLVIATVAVAARALHDRRRSLAVAAGLLSALAGMTRPSFLLFVGAFAVAMLIGAPSLPRKERLARAGLFVAAYVIGLLPFVARNYIVSGHATTVVTLSHAITIALIPPEGGIVPPHLSSSVPPWSEAALAALQMFRDHPRAELWLEIRKLLFTLGFTALGPPGMRAQPFPLFLILFAGALWMRAVPRHLLVAILAFLASHIAAVVIAWPWTYGYKTILPVQYFFLFCGMHLALPELGLTERLLAPFRRRASAARG